MKKTYSVIFVLLLFTMPACVSHRYYSAISDVEKIPCFGKESVNKEHFLKELNETEKKYLYEEALVKVNQIFINGMFPFLFSEPFETKNEEELLKKVGECPEYKKSSDIRAFVSLHSQTTDKQCPKCDDKKEVNINISCNDALNVKNIPHGDQKGKSADAPPANGNLKQIKLVVSSYLYSLSPADRLEKVYTLVVPLDKEVKFIATDSIRFGNFGDVVKAPG